MFGIVSAYVASLRTSLLGTAILLVGVVVFYAAQQRHRVPRASPSEG
jgi:hypothetical protein